jgi:hypothetical protein
LCMGQASLVRHAGVSVETIIRMERVDGALSTAKAGTLEIVKRVLEAAGVIFVDENGEGPGVRLRKSKSGWKK